MINPELITTGISGSLTAGDIITFEGRPSWRRRLWCAIRYMRHNNPLLKPPRQFVVLPMKEGHMCYYVGPDKYWEEMYGFLNK